MATSLQQLLDEITWRTGEPRWPALSIADNGLAHAGRALNRLAEYGLDSEGLGGPRESLVSGLGASCDAAAAALAQRSEGLLTNLMGAAADIAGRAAPRTGRAERWALSVEFAAAADGCAQLAQRLPGGDKTGQLDLVRRQAATIERAALANPPTQLARANLDRLVPVSELPAATVGSTAAAEAAAALVAAIYRADERGGITLRELRTVTAAAQISSEYIVAVATALPGGDQAQPWHSAGTAWHVARDATADFDDCRWTGPTEQSEVIAAALLVQSGLAHDLGPVTTPGTADLNERRNLPHFLSDLQTVANQNPVLASQLRAVARTWEQTGALSTAVNLVHLENMPNEWARAHLAGRSVRTRHANLDIITAALDRAAPLSTALAADFAHLAADRAPTQPHLTDLYASRAAGPRAGGQLLAAAHQAEQALAATRTPFNATTRHRPDGPNPGR